jgi:hypothetical protein
VQKFRDDNNDLVGKSPLGLKKSSDLSTYHEQEEKKKRKVIIE